MQDPFAAARAAASASASAASAGSDGDRAAVEVERIAPGIHVLRRALPARVEPVNCWLLEEDDGGLCVVDTGLAHGAAEAWRGALTALDRTPGDIRRIVITHHHPDHVGGAAVLHELSGAPLLAAGSTIEQALDVWGDAAQHADYFAALARHLRRHGLPDAALGDLTASTEHAAAAVRIPPRSAWVELVDEQTLRIAGRQWRILVVPGHADGHLVLHAERGPLLVGDHVLERISPAVGRFPRHAEDPLGAYLDSLARVAALDPHDELLALPGHGAPFRGVRARAHELVAHHQARLDDCVEAVASALNDPAVESDTITAFAVARRVFARVFERDPLDRSDLRFATTETLAHLEHARLLGRVERRGPADGSLAGGPPHTTWSVAAEAPVG